MFSLPTAIVTGYLLFNSTINFTTNSAFNSTTNLDEILGNITSLSLNLSYPVLNSNGIPITTITNSQQVTAIAPDGRGYQEYITMPTGAGGFYAYLPGSLSYETVTNVIARTNSGNITSLFSSQSWSPLAFTLNPNCWLYNFWNRTAIMVGSTAAFGYQAPQLGGCAITPRHIATCTHAPLSTGNNVAFVDINGNVQTNTVLATTTLAGCDITIALLSSNLPPTIYPVSILPTNYIVYMSLVHPNIQMIGIRQDMGAYPFLGVNWIGNYINPAPSSVWLGTNWNSLVISGDSGHPVFMMVGTNLALITHWHTAIGNQDNYANFFTAITNACHYLSTNQAVGSDYMPSNTDLSAWPNTY